MIVFDPVTYKQTTRDQWQAATQARHQSSPLTALARLLLRSQGG